MRTRWVRLDFEPAARKRGYVAISIQNLGRRFLPVPGALPLLARLDDPYLQLSVDPADGRLSALSWPPRALACFRRLRGAWKGAELAFSGVTFYPDGSRLESRRYRKHIEAARRHMSAWDGEFLGAHPEIVAGWPFAPAQRRVSSEPPRVAVAVHLYYTELWDEFETLLGRWRVPFRLFLTLNAPDEALAERARAAFPGAEVRVVENLGRDVRPFLMFLEQGAFEPCDARLQAARQAFARRRPPAGLRRCAATCEFPRPHRGPRPRRGADRPLRRRARSRRYRLGAFSVRIHGAKTCRCARQEPDRCSSAQRTARRSPDRARIRFLRGDDVLGAPRRPGAARRSKTFRNRVRNRSRADGRRAGTRAGATVQSCRPIGGLPRRNDDCRLSLHRRHDAVAADVYVLRLDRAVVGLLPCAR